jgi:hypothetical protein
LSEKKKRHTASISSRSLTLNSHTLTSLSLELSRTLLFPALPALVYVAKEMFVLGRGLRQCASTALRSRVSSSASWVPSSSACSPASCYSSSADDGTLSVPIEGTVLDPACGLGEDTAALQEVAMEFARREFLPNAHAWDRDHVFPTELLQVRTLPIIYTPVHTSLHGYACVCVYRYTRRCDLCVACMG